MADPPPHSTPRAFLYTKTFFIKVFPGLGILRLWRAWGDARRQRWESRKKNTRQKWNSSGKRRERTYSVQFQNIVGVSCWIHLTAESWTPGSVRNPGIFRGCSCEQASVLSHWLVAESRSPFLNLLGFSVLTEKTGYLQLLRHGIMRGFTSGFI